MAADPARLTDLPRRVAPEDYERCRDAAAKRLESHPDVAAVYAAGSVRHPGQSDLDLFVVLKDGAPLRTLLRPADLPEPGPYIANHSFAHYPKRIFEEVHYLFPLFSPLVPLVEKEAVAIAPPPSDPREARLLAAAYAADYLFRKVFALAEVDSRPERPVRSLLSSLHTARYTFELARRATGVDLAGGFFEAVDRLRGGWFESDPARAAEEAAGLASDCARIGFETAWSLGEYFLRSQDAAGPAVVGPRTPRFGPPAAAIASDLARLANREWAILFGPDRVSPFQAWERAGIPLVDRALPGSRRLRVYPRVVASGIARLFATYAEGGGPWSAWIRRSFRPGSPAPAPISSPALERRVRLLDDIARLSLRAPIKNSYPYGFPPGGCQGLRKWILAAIVRRRLSSFARRLLKETS